MDKKIKKGCDFACPVEAALDVIGGKWKGIILHHLGERTYRFNELKRMIPGITQRMLTKQLRELEADQVVNRKVFAKIPPMVEYSLTDFGKTLSPVFRELLQWGTQYIEDIKKIRGQAED